MGFMPADNPKVVVYVAIDNPKGVIQYGGTVSAPVAKHILSDVASILKIDKTTSGMPKVYNWMDQKYVIVPNVIGLSLDDAKKVLKGFKVEYSGLGSKVIDQNPHSNTYFNENGTVRLMTE